LLIAFVIRIQKNQQLPPMFPTSVGQQTHLQVETKKRNMIGKMTFLNINLNDLLLISLFTAFASPQAISLWKRQPFNPSDPNNVVRFGTAAAYSPLSDEIFLYGPVDGSGPGDSLHYADLKTMNYTLLSVNSSIPVRARDCFLFSSPDGNKAYVHSISGLLQ
jgi:hypothetical protein